MVESQFTISMFVRDHLQSDNPAGLYLIHPLSPAPVDYHGFSLPEDGLPIIFPHHLKHHMLPSAPMFRLGSVIYFFGGRTYTPLFAICDHSPWNEDVPLEDQLRVWAFDTNNPEAGFFSVAPLNFPKEMPCIFAAWGKLYALGSNLTTYPIASVETYSGHFERYDPESNKWQILPDPPKPFRRDTHFDMAAFKPILIHPLVFMKDMNDTAVICFNLNTEKWVTLPSEFLPPAWSLNLDPFKPVYCDGHLYSIQSDPESKFDPVRCTFPLRIVSGPAKECDRLKCPRVVATIEQVDGHKAVYNRKYARPRRHFYHVGHKIFCYIVDSPLTFLDEPIGYHGIWIKFFKEVKVSKRRNEFRLLDSFCYRFYQPFSVHSIDFCFSGSLPNAWKKGLSLNIGGLCSHGNEHFQSEVGLKKALNLLKLMIHKKEKTETKKKKILPESMKKIVPESKKKIVPESTKKIVPESTKENLPESKKKILPESSKLQEEIRLLTAQLSHKKQLLEESMSVQSKDKQMLEECY